MSRASAPILFLGLCIVFLSTATARAGRLFVGGEIIPLDSRADGIVVEDLNGDGRPDVAALLGTRGRVSVSLARPDGYFDSPATYEAGLSPVFVLANGDFDGNGKKDLFIVNSGSATVSVLLNRGDGTFLDAKSTPVGTNPRTAGLADFNSDGKLDAVTSDLIAADSGRLTILLGGGDGSFAAGHPVDVGDNAHSLVVSDFDGDGKPDIAVAHSRTLSRFRSRGDGTFEPDVPFRLNSLNPRFLIAGEFTGDDRPDLAAFLDGGDVLVLVNDGVGGFVARILFQNTLGPTRVLDKVDFDQDGIEDIVTRIDRGKAEGGIRISRGGPDASFPTLVELFTGVSFGALALRDIDGKGSLDALLARTDAADLVLLRGTSASQLALPSTAALEAEPRDITISDLDPNGTRGLAAASSSALHFLRLEKDGELAVADVEPLPGRAFQAIAAGDFDGDGTAELALSDLASGSVVLRRPAGAAGAVAKILERKVQDYPQRLVARDIDGDGVQDILVLDQVAAAVTLLLRPGVDPAPGRIDIPVAAAQTALEAADLDADGHADLAVSARSGLFILLGDGKGGFTLRRTIEDLRSAAGLAALGGRGGAVDLAVVVGKRLVVLRGVAGAGDPSREELELPSPGRLFGVVGAPDGSGHSIVIGLNNGVFVARWLGGGGFGATDSFPVGALLRAGVLADLDGDGLIDVAAADFNASSVEVLRGAAPAPAARFRRGDADGDGRASLTDAVVVLDRLFRGGAALACADAADSDDNGKLDLSDPIRLLVHLFQGGQPLPPPGGESCGEDPTSDALETCQGGCP